MPKQEIITWNESSSLPDKEGANLLMKVYVEDNVGFLNGMFHDENYYAVTCSHHYKMVGIPRENIIAWCYHPKGNIEH